jgi:hypothetical protein
MSTSDIPTFAQLAADPEIAALLDFTPAPRKIERPDGWTPERQRELIACIAFTGSPRHAAEAMGKDIAGAKHLYRSDGGESFRDAWRGAMELHRDRERQARAGAPPRHFLIPGIGAPPRPSGSAAANGTKYGEPDVNGNFQQPGQRLNHLGEWEDAASIERRGEEAAESIRHKLLRCRRIYLCSIAGDAGKRAAFEILTELPIDWDLAREMQPQPDEPWRPTTQRDPDWVLTAESGWSFGEIGYGPNRLAEARQVINDVRAQRGQEPLEWDAN